MNELKCFAKNNGNDSVSFFTLALCLYFCEPQQFRSILLSTTDPIFTHAIVALSHHKGQHKLCLMLNQRSRSDDRMFSFLYKKVENGFSLLAINIDLPLLQEWLKSAKNSDHLLRHYPSSNFLKLWLHVVMQEEVNQRNTLSERIFIDFSHFGHVALTLREAKCGQMNHKASMIHPAILAAKNYRPKLVAKGGDSREKEYSSWAIVRLLL